MPTFILQCTRQETCSVKRLIFAWYIQYVCCSAFLEIPMETSAYTVILRYVHFRVIFRSWSVLTLLMTDPTLYVIPSDYTQCAKGPWTDICHRPGCSYQLQLTGPRALCFLGCSIILIPGRCCAICLEKLLFVPALLRRDKK